MRENDRLEHELISSWMESADVGICVMDHVGAAVILNASAGRHLTVDPRAALNRPARLLFRSATDAQAVDE